MHCYCHSAHQLGAVLLGQLRGKLGDCPKPSSKLLLQENIQPPYTKQLSSLACPEPAGRGWAAAAVGSPSPAREGQGHACVPCTAGCTASPSASSPSEPPRGEWSPLGMVCTLCRCGCAALQGQRLSLENLPTEC